MPRLFFNADVECLPLAGIIELQRQNLLKADIVGNASGSALYKELWQSAGVARAVISSRGDLKKFPFVNSDSIKQAYACHSPGKIVNLENVRLWSATSGSTGKSKWIPYSDADLEMFKQVLMRGLYQQKGKVRPHCVLALTSPAPFVSDLLTNMAIIAHTELGLSLEMISAGLGDAESAVSLASERKIDVLIAFPSVALKMAEEVKSHLKSEIAARWKNTRNLKWYLAGLYFKMKKPKARDVFKLRYGLFSGESVRPYREALKRDFGFDAYETYALTEFPCVNFECEKHNGIHIWCDCCVPEMIPQSELDKEENTQGYIPQAIFLDEALPETRGEYVVTTFSQALPLVRYRTSDIVEIVSSGVCGCGRTHPRVRVLHRLDDIINMGLIRFSVGEIENALARVSRSGKVRRWQLLLRRQGYKPYPRFDIESADMTDPEAMAREVRECLNQIEILRVGVEQGLVLAPEITFCKRIEPATTPTGKTRRVMYAPDW